MSKCQNYIPIYNFFFIKRKNFDSINLNQKKTFSLIKKSETSFIAILRDENEKEEEKVFFKLSF